MDFIAIDFETANRYRNSACSIGFAEVHDNEIVNSKEILIRPDPFEFDDYNVAIHGITPEMVKDAPTFGECWPELAPLIQNNIVVAHNAPFDISVLRRTLEHFEIPVPTFNIICTYRMAKAAFPESGSYRLNIICERLGIELKHHHNALDDAEACAKILCELSNKANASTVEELSTAYSLMPGYYHDEYDYCPCRIERCRNIANKKQDISNIKPEYVDEDFCNKNFVFTGTLLSMSRAKAKEVVIKGGGIAQKGVTLKTDYLVVGIQDMRFLAGHTESSKMRKVKELQEKGCRIKVIGEDEFVNMIDDELYKLCF